MQLHEWTTIYLKQRDLIKREIARLEETEQGLLKHKNDGSTELIIIKEKLDPADLAKAPRIITCLNTKDNLRTLQEHWTDYAGQPQLLLIFASPKTNEQWLIKPHHHDKIADEESLHAGLVAMHENISTL